MLTSIKVLVSIFLVNGICGALACRPLSEVFAQPLIEDNINGATISASGGEGTGLDVGDLDLWAENPVNEADIDGTTIGSSSGSCTLLPGSMKWNCLMELTFENDEGTIVISGTSMNNNDPSFVAITGGTGCFEGASGTIEMTALNIVTDFDAFQYVLIR